MKTLLFLTLIALPSMAQNLIYDDTMDEKDKYCVGIKEALCQAKLEKIIKARLKREYNLVTPDRLQTECDANPERCETLKDRELVMLDVQRDIEREKNNEEWAHRDSSQSAHGEQKTTCVRMGWLTKCKTR